MAQMIRAILLARATAASLRGLRSSNCNSQPDADCLPGLATRMTDIAPTTSSCRNLSLPALLILPDRCLPAVECSFGVSPNQAARCRPDSESLTRISYGTSQSPCQQHDTRGVKERLRRCDGALEVLREPPIAINP